ERLDGIKDARDFAFVAREHDAIGERIGDEQEPFDREIAYIDWATRRDLVLALDRDLDLRRFFLAVARPQRADDAASEVLQEFGFFRGRKPDKYDNTIAEQDRDPVRARAHGQGQRRNARQLFVAFERGGVDAIAHEHGAQLRLVAERGQVGRIHR